MNGSVPMPEVVIPLAAPVHIAAAGAAAGAAAAVAGELMARAFLAGLVEERAEASRVLSYHRDTMRMAGWDIRPSGSGVYEIHTT